MSSPMLFRTSLSSCTCRRALHATSRLYATEAPAEVQASLLPPHKRRRLESTTADEAITRLPSTHATTQTVLNRTGAIDSGLHRELTEIVRTFRAPIRHAFAYGSAVFRQAGYADTDQPMLDFIFAVSEPVQWHALNMRQNGHHYASLPRVLGSTFVSHVQSSYGGKMWFNVECEVNGRLIKYGVISVKQLCDDLRDWETLYPSGRMQKPIHVLRDDARVRLNEEINLKSAFKTALLLLPERFTEVDLYRQIASLSYTGDFRMRVGENPGKVGNIVSAQYDRFRTLYGPFFTSSSISPVLSRVNGDDSSDLALDRSPRAMGALARKLPSGLKDKVQAYYERRYNIRRAYGKQEEEELTGPDEAALWTKIAKDHQFSVNLAKGLEAIVARPAFYQSAKGIISVGATKGMRYVGPKLRKRWLGSA